MISSNTLPRTFARVLVTGGAGFVGSAVVQQLLGEGVETIAVDDLSKGTRSSLPSDNTSGFSFVRADLRDRQAAIDIIRGVDWVIHLASQAYGVGYGRLHQTAGFLLNTQINANVVDAVVTNDVPGVLAASSSCVYASRESDAQFVEDEGFDGEPEAANHGYGWAKRMLEIALFEAAREGRCEAVIARPVNIYGASYGWFGEHSHVIPALTKRLLDGEDPIAIWGNGRQVRNYIHVSDAAHVLIELSRRAPSGSVVNVSPFDTATVNDVLTGLMTAFSVQPRIIHDLSKPTGAPCRDVSTSRLRSVLPDFAPRVSLQDGLAEMRTWYERHRLAGNFS